MKIIALVLWPLIIGSTVGWWLYSTFTGVAHFFQTLVLAF